MSPLPTELIDRWDKRPDPRPGLGVVYWHMLLGDNSQVAAVAATAQSRLARFPGLHMTPLRWLHLTLLVAGTTDDIDAAAMQEMLIHARSALSNQPPATVQLGRIIYHPEAIMLAVAPREALGSMLRSVQSATRTVTGRDGSVNGGSSARWIPHITLCYSEACQPAEPIISFLGTNLGTYETTVDSISLVVQRGPERLWDWEPVSTIRLTGNG